VGATVGLEGWLALSVLIIVTPGPDTALVVTNAFRGGARAALATVAGVATGTLAWSVGSAFGVAQLLERSQPAFTALKLAGAAYLVYLGLRALLQRTEPASTPRAPGPTLPARAGWRQGLVSNLTNAKTGLFFVTVLPQFLQPGDPPARLAAMVLVFEVVLVSWLSVYSVAVGRLGAGPLGARLRVWLSRLSGVVLVGLGARLAFERR
jgi:threonine/homoserine/homoserine lactone efflux protein